MKMAPDGRPAIRLSQVLAYLPARTREERPPFLRTLALWSALERHGFPCEIWNAIIESRWKIQVVCALRAQGELLDWLGHSPYDYPRIYPIYQGGNIRGETGHELIPGKREEATHRFPEVDEQVRMALEWAHLEQGTPGAAGEGHPYRL